MDGRPSDTHGESTSERLWADVFAGLIARAHGGVVGSDTLRLLPDDVLGGDRGPVPAPWSADCVSERRKPEDSGGAVGDPLSIEARSALKSHTLSTLVISRWLVSRPTRPRTFSPWDSRTSECRLEWLSLKDELREVSVVVGLEAA